MKTELPGVYHLLRAMVLVIVILWLTSCESKSGQLARERSRMAVNMANIQLNREFEKVCIIEVSTPTYIVHEDMYSITYKIKRLEKGSVAYTTMLRKNVFETYSVKDTIFVASISMR